MVILLANWLRANGWRVAVLSRGYKRAKGLEHLLVSDGTSVLAGPADAGDEPFLIARRCPDTIVAVGANRASLGRWVLARHSVDCIILDDGFQHVGLQRDVDVVLLDATDAAGLDAMVPAGRLREPLQGLGRATVVAITRAESRDDVAAVQKRLREAGLPCEDAIEVSFKPESLVSVLGEQTHPLEWARGKKAWLVSGIGNGQSFRRSAEVSGIDVVGERVFQDHYRYQAGDVSRIRTEALSAGADLVLTTEKDAGKLSVFLEPQDPWWALRIRADVIRGEARLRNAVLGCRGKVA
jgi:tetraacyldisaccharide 4'-kinase